MLIQGASHTDYLTYLEHQQTVQAQADELFDYQRTRPGSRVLPSFDTPEEAFRWSIQPITDVMELGSKIRQAAFEERWADVVELREEMQSKFGITYSFKRRRSKHPSFRKDEVMLGGWEVGCFCACGFK